MITLAPWFHAMGVIGYLNGLVMAGTTAVVHMRFDPVRYLEDAVRHRVTSLGGAPPVFVALLQVPGIDDADLSARPRRLQRRRPAAAAAHRAAAGAAPRRARSARATG